MVGRGNLGTTRKENDIIPSLAKGSYRNGNSNLSTFALVGAILLAAAGGGYWYTTTPEGSFYWQQFKNKISALVR